MPRVKTLKRPAMFLDGDPARSEYEDIHTCSEHCPCQTGGQPLPDFTPAELRPFAADLARAKTERKPHMALRPDSRFPEEMDDIVVEDVRMFRAEAMADDVWWMACYFHNGEQLVLQVAIEKKPRRIVVQVTDEPKEWVDLDA